jgi:hypothetical protein
MHTSIRHYSLTVERDALIERASNSHRGYRNERSRVRTSHSAMSSIGDHIRALLRPVGRSTAAGL